MADRPPFPTDESFRAQRRHWLPRAFAVGLGGQGAPGVGASRNNGRGAAKPGCLRSSGGRWVVAARLVRLEQVLGGRVDELSWAVLEDMVEQGAPEALDLDFKQEHYGNSDSDKRELCKDVAALANTSGGVILIGVAEGDGAASGLAPVPFSDVDERRYRQVAANGVLPLPRFDLLRVASPSDPASGVLAIVVPRSPLAPHAVVVNDGLRYPRRHGSTTLYLTEPEVASAYRQRFSLGPERLGLVVQRERELLDRLDQKEPWLVATLVPDLDGHMVVDRASLREFQTKTSGQAAQMPWYGANYLHCGAGFRRLWAHGGTDSEDQSGFVRWCALELHADGAGTYAVQLGDRARTPHGGEAAYVLLDDEAIAASILTALERLSQHAWESGAGGLANLRVRAWSARNDKRVALSHSRNFGGGQYAPAVPPPQGVDVSAPIDSLYPPGPELVMVASTILRDIAQSLGVPEVGQLDVDGKVRRRYWGQGVQNHMKAWCEARGVEFTEDQPAGV